LKAINVLYITYDGLTDQLGRSQILPYILGLNKVGYLFTVISFEKQQGLYSLEETRQLLEKNNIDWHPNGYTKRPPVLSSVYDVIKLIHLSKKIAKKKDIKLVHCRSYIPSLAGLVLKKKFGIKFIFDMRGFWADERVDGLLWDLSNPIYSLIYSYFKKKESQFLQFSDCTISLTNSGKREMLKWEGSSKFSPILVIPCSVDVKDFSNSKFSDDKKTELRLRLGIKNEDKVLVYLGSIGTWYMLPEMLSFFKNLYQQNPNWKFLFITREKELVLKEIEDSDVDIGSVIITEAKRKDIPSYLSIVNWGMFFIRPTFSKISSSPTKQGEIMSMGIPLIINSGVGDCDEIVNNYDAGIVIDSFEEEAFVKAAKSIENSTFSPFEITIGASEIFSLEKALKSYQRVYSDAFETQNLV
jgi:glycosyltransferase involved in cell wall biosynthesis|tara:strand:+ start:34 stop:1272 length:1239 start_codon:yes stop_codon:yes gene_type:complete